MSVSELVKWNDTEQNEDNFWLPTPENPGNEEGNTPIQRKILEEIRARNKKEELDTNKDVKLRKTLFDMLQWEGSQIEDDRKLLEQTIVDYNDIFARHQLDIG